MEGEKKPITLHTVLIVEKLINENNGDYVEADLYRKLDCKMEYGIFKSIMDYLEHINKILIEKDGKVVYIWNPSLASRCRDRPDILA